MGKKYDFLKESSSIIEEIEGQLSEIVQKKKYEVEKELEGKIRKEEQEAKNKIDKIEEELVEEIETLSSYKKVLSEFESQKENIKSQIKEHLSKAIQSQTQIENMAGQTLSELKKVVELNQKLEEMHKETLTNVGSLTKDIEEKYGIGTQIQESLENEKVEFDLEADLSKLKKIKELLGANEIQKEEKKESEPGEKLGLDSEPEQVSAQVPESEPEPMPNFEPEMIESEQESKDEEDKTEESVEKEEEIVLPKEESSPHTEDEGKDEELVLKEEDEESVSNTEARIRESVDTLGKYRKQNEELSYFEKNGKVILDGESLISALNSKLEEAKKLYMKLAQTESPKEQFFIKQEIIWHQEVLRELLLASLKMCEIEGCSFPKYTRDILNADVFKDILEKINAENWSNKEDFSSFENYMKKLKNSFYARLTHHAEYLESLFKELEIE